MRAAISITFNKLNCITYARHFVFICEKQKKYLQECEKINIAQQQ